MARAGARRDRVGLNARQLNRATLDRQLLLSREQTDVVDAVRRVVALQAQEPASPHLALWNRVAGFDPADLAAAYADRVVVRATLMRLALHAVHADDYPHFHNAMLPNLRGPRLGDRRFLASGLSIADADRLVPHLLKFTSRPRTAAEIEEMLGERLGGPRKGVWWALRTYAPLQHVPTDAPWSFRSPSSYVAAQTKLGAEERDESLRWLVLRYLAAFGPASVQDIAQFSIIKRSVLQQAVKDLGDGVEEVTGPDGETLFDLPGAEYPAEETVAPPRLLPMWESILLAYADRGRVIPPEYRSVILRRNGDVLPTLLVDGHVAGVWRSVDGGIEATAFQRLPDDAWRGLAAEARALLAFLADRDPAVYRRYGHWWEKDLPGRDVRVLTG